MLPRSLARRAAAACTARHGSRCLSTAAADQTYDLAVVGGGVMGVWAAIAAAKRGASVALADQFEPAHVHGSSHGDGRIYRLAYEQDHYVDMMERSLPLWHELQEAAGEPLLACTGGITVADAAAAGENRNDALRAIYARRGIPHETLSAAATNERFPQFSLSPSLEALYQPDFGVLFASKSVAAAWAYARALGVDTYFPFRAAAFHSDGGQGQGSVVLSEQGAELRSRSLVVAPGAWLSSLSHTLFGLRIPTRVSAETVCYYRPREEPAGSERGPVPDHSYRSMPVFIFQTENGCEGMSGMGYYGLPTIDVPGVKASAHYCGPTVHPDARPAAAGGPAAVLGRTLAGAAGEEEAAARRVAEVVASTSRLVRDSLPHCEQTPFETQSCLYTSTCDHDYVLSRAPGHERVVLAGGGSGHAFKMGPALGEMAAAAALGWEPPLALAPFAVERLLGASLPDESLASRR